MHSDKTQPDNKQIVQRYMDECWSQGKLNNLNELVASNSHLHDPVFPSLSPGAENLRRHIETCRTGFPDLKFRIDDTIAERDEVVAHWTATGTHKGNFLGMPPTHKQATVSGTSIYRFEDSKIVEEWAHWDLMSMMHQLGLHMVPENQTEANPSSKTEPGPRS